MLGDPRVSRRTNDPTESRGPGSLHGITRIVMALLVIGAITGMVATGCDSPYDDPLNGDDTTDPLPPNDVELFSAVGGDSSVTLYWVEGGGPDPDHIEITWVPGGETPQSVSPGAESTTITGISNGTEYTFTAKTVSGQGAASDGVSVVCAPAEQTLFGGSGSDMAYSIAPTSDGGFVVGGVSTSVDLENAFPPFLTDNGKQNSYIAKFDNAGVMEWHRLHGTVNDDVAHSVTETVDGGYLVAGHWEVVDGDGEDFYVLKLSAAGNNEWNRAPGGSGYDTAYGCAQTSDGGFIVGGYSHSDDIPGLTYSANGDFYVVKYDASGTLVWESMFGGTGWDRIYALERTSDDGCFVTGTSYSMDLPGSTQNGFEDFYVARLDSVGNVTWQKMFGGTNYDALLAMDLTSDGGFVVAGYSQSTDISGVTHPDPVPEGSQFPSAATYVAKLDSSGTVSWQKMFESGMAHSIVQTDDGGYIIASTTNSTGQAWPTPQYHILRLDTVGNLIWEKTYGGNGDDFAESILQTAAGGYIVAGHSDSTDISGAASQGGTDSYLLFLD